MEQMPITINTTVGELNIVLAALAKQPFESVVETITSYRTQAVQQMQAAQSPAEPSPVVEDEGAAE